MVWLLNVKLTAEQSTYTYSAMAYWKLETGPRLFHVYVQKICWPFVEGWVQSDWKYKLIIIFQKKIHCSHRDSNPWPLGQKLKAITNRLRRLSCFHLLNLMTQYDTRNVWLPIYCFWKQRRLIGHNTRFMPIIGADTLWWDFTGAKQIWTCGRSSSMLKIMNSEQLYEFESYVL